MRDCYRDNKLVQPLLRALTAVDQASDLTIKKTLAELFDVTAGGATGGGEALPPLEILDSRRLGGTFVLDRMWERLGIGQAIRAAYEGGERPKGFQGQVYLPADCR